MKSMDDSIFFKNLHKKCIIKTPKINHENEVTHWEVHLKILKIKLWLNFKKWILKKYSKLSRIIQTKHQNEISVWKIHAVNADLKCNIANKY